MFHEYTVKSGDTLSMIAKEFYDDSSLYTQLAEYNNIDDPNIISVGQIIQIPQGFYIFEAIEDTGDVPVISFSSRPATTYAQSTAQSFEDIEIWVEVGGKTRKVKSNQTLSIVPQFLKPRKVLCKTVNGKSVKWSSTGYHVSEKNGLESDLSVKSWGKESKWLWFPGERPKTCRIVGKDSGGKEVSSTLQVYPGDRVQHEIDFEKSPFYRGLRKVFDDLDELLKNLTGRSIEVRFLVGKLSYKAGFEEASDSPDVFYGYELAGSLNPVFAVKFVQPFGLNAIIPAALKEFSKFLEFNLYVEGSFNLAMRFFQDAIDNKGGDLQGDFKLEFGIEGKANIVNSGWFGMGEYKVIDAKLAGTSAVVASLGPLVEQRGLGIRADVFWEGIKISGSILALDGLYTYKKEITLIDKKSLMKDDKFYFVEYSR